MLTSGMVPGAFFIAHMRLKLLIKIPSHLSAQCLLWAALGVDRLCQQHLAAQHPWPGRACLSLPEPALGRFGMLSKFQHLCFMDLMTSPVLSFFFFELIYLGYICLIETNVLLKNFSVPKLSF